MSTKTTEERLATLEAQIQGLADHIAEDVHGWRSSRMGVGAPRRRDRTRVVAGLLLAARSVASPPPGGGQRCLTT